MNSRAVTPIARSEVVWTYRAKMGGSNSMASRMPPPTTSPEPMAISSQVTLGFIPCPYYRASFSLGVLSLETIQEEARSSIPPGRA